MNLRRRSDQGIGNSDAVAAPVAKAVMAGKARDLEANVPYMKEVRQCRNPLMLALIADTRVEFGDSDDRNGGTRLQAVHNTHRRLSISQIVDEDASIEKMAH
jgi:hypothetical protein